MELSLEKEFNLIKTGLLFQKTIKMKEDYNKTVGSIELPSFVDQDLKRDVDNYITRLIEENRVNEVLLNLIN